MKKRYQNHLKKVKENTGAIDLDFDLDAVLALPQPLREVTFVKEVCESFRKRALRKQSSLKNSEETSNCSDTFGPDTKNDELSGWYPSQLELDNNQKN